MQRYHKHIFHLEKADFMALEPNLRRHHEGNWRDLPWFGANGLACQLRLCWEARHCLFLDRLSASGHYGIWFLVNPSL